MKRASHSCGQETELMNIETAHHHEEDKMRVLYEASYKGCVSTMNSLLHGDPGILRKISSQTIYSSLETPLHISASHGHLEFTKILLSNKPADLALELNSLRSTPLHLASAEGHIEIVKQLVEAREEACLFRDQEGKIPLHYAVIRGRREVVLELIKAKPESLNILDDMGKSIFHLCVIFNHLEILKSLVALDTYDFHDLLVEQDLDGKNTILHLAILLKQVETVSYLIKIPEIRSEASNLKNDMGYTASDLVQRIPKESKSLEIQIVLMESGIKCGKKEMIDVASKEEKLVKKKKKKKKKKSRWLRNVFKRIDKWVKYNGNWMEDMRGNLSLVATVIATITFQGALNPPGGVVQQGLTPIDDSIFNITSMDKTNIHDGPLGCLWFNVTDRYTDHTYLRAACPGIAIHAYRNQDDFRDFITYNTISFVASLCVALLLVSGVPLKHNFVMWILSIGMGIALTCLLSAYFIGLNLVADYGWYTTGPVFITTSIFMGLYVLVGVYIAVKFVIWVVNTLKEKLIRCWKSTNQEKGTDVANA